MVNNIRAGPPPETDQPGALQEPTRPDRPRRLIGALLAVTILTGVSSRLAARHLPDLLAKDLGDALWPMMFYLIVLRLNPRAFPLVAALTAFTLACAFEFLKCIHAPAIDALRANLLAGFLLGRIFLWTNFIAYVLGTCAAIAIDHLLLRCGMRHVRVILP